MELVEGLGDGGQPENLPREVVLGGDRFLFDRVVPLRRQDLVRVAQESSTIAYARAETAPFDTIYLSVPDRSEDELARYRPEAISSTDEPCPSETGPSDLVDASGAGYVFAGVETDVPADSLQPAEGEAEGILADPGAEPPFAELFIGAADGLTRHLRLTDDGRPAALSQSLAFGGIEYAFDAEVTDAVDPAR